MRPLLIGLAAALALAACQPEASPEALPEAGPSAPTLPEASAPDRPGSVEGAEPSQPSASVVLALDSEGLRLVATPQGSTRLVPFGQEMDETVAVLERARGEVRERGVNTECGAGPLELINWGDGLTVWFSNGRFVGWSVDGRGPEARRYTTMAGVGAGSTRAALEAAYSARVEETTLGTEFSTGSLFGVLDGPGPEAEITNLWGGTLCAFR